MRFVETKTPEQQSCLMLHRTRHLFVRQQTASMRSAPILPSSGSSRRSDAMAWRRYSKSSPI
jgi:transposase